MTQIDVEAFKYAIDKIDDGFVFEEFSLSFLSAVLGYEFIPVGGVKDKGIDGLEYTFSRRSFEKNIYQLSTEHNSEGKIKKSIDKLISNKIGFDSFTYVTNRVVHNKDTLMDNFFIYMGNQLEYMTRIGLQITQTTHRQL